MVLSGTGARPHLPDPVPPEYPPGSSAPNKKGRKSVPAPKMLVPRRQHRVAFLHHPGKISPCLGSTTILCRTGANAGLAKSSRCVDLVVFSF
jgi:hypothetical protein